MSLGSVGQGGGEGEYSVNLGGLHMVPDSPYLIPTPGYLRKKKQFH